jgi:hypothetical protein
MVKIAMRLSQCIKFLELMTKHDHPNCKSVTNQPDTLVFFTSNLRKLHKIKNEDLAMLQK